MRETGQAGDAWSPAWTVLGDPHHSRRRELPSFATFPPQSQPILRIMRKLMILMVLASVTRITAQIVELPPATPAARQVKAAVDDSDLGDLRADVRNFYAPAGYRLAWTRSGQPTPQARSLVAIFAAAADKGLDPADYALPHTGDDAHFDVAMTAAAMQYASDLHQGRVDPRDLGFDLDVDARRLYLPALMTS